MAAGQAWGRGAVPWYPNPRSRAGLVTTVRVSSQARQWLADSFIVRRLRLRTPGQLLGSGSAPVHSSMAQLDIREQQR